MNPVNPWLDPVEVRRLAERLLQPAGQSTSFPDAGFDDSFVGFAASAPATPPASQPALAPPAPPPVSERVTMPQAPAATPPAPESRPAPQAPPTAPAPEPASEHAEPVKAAPQAAAQPPRGPFLERISRFRDWLHDQFSASGVFILDREGAVIFDESGHGKLHFLARSLALASRRPGGSSTNVHVKVGAQSVLEVVPVDSLYGGLVLGAVLPSPLTPTAATAVMEALKLVASPPQEQAVGSI